MDNVKQLCSLLSKCKNNQVKACILEWGVLSQIQPPINYDLPQRQLIKTIEEAFKELQLDSSSVRTLELICLKTTQPSHITWYLHILKDLNLKQLQVTTHEIKKQLQNQVDKLGLYEVTLAEYHSALWGRISKPMDKKCVYFIYHFHSDALLCNVKQNTEIKLVLKQAFKNTFDCGELRLKQLKSNDPNSIAQIYLHGEKSKYTYDNKHYKAKKRKCQSGNELLEIDRNSGIKLENKQKTLKSVHAQRSIFSDTIPPSLQEVNVHVKSTLKRNKNEEPPLTMDVNFCGKNIFKGLENMAKENLYSPTPTLLTNITEHCTNNIKMEN